MEDSRGSLLGTFTLLVSDIALLDAAFVVFGSRGSDEILSIGILPWLIMAVASLAMYRLFLRSERSLMQATLFLVASYAVTVAVLFVFFVRLPSFLSVVFALVFWTVPQFRIFIATRTPPTIEKLTARLEGVIAFLLFLLLFIVGLDKQLAYAIPCSVSVLMCLTSLIVMRTYRSGALSGGTGMRGVAVILTFFLLIGAAIAVFLLFAYASLGDLVAQGVAAGLRGIRVLFGFLMRFMRWIVSLIPTPDYGGEFPPDMVAMDGGSGFAEEMVSGSQIIPIILVCALAIGLAAFVIVAVIRLRRVRLGGSRKMLVPDIKRSRTRSKSFFVRRWLDLLRFIGLSVLYRNTPQGVFVRLERWGRHRRCGRAVGETQRCFLSRLSAFVPGHEDALLCLADELDARWYGGEPALSRVPMRELSRLRRAFSFGRLRRCAQSAETPR